MAKLDGSPFLVWIFEEGVGFDAMQQNHLVSVQFVATRQNQMLLFLAGIFVPAKDAPRK